MESRWRLYQNNSEKRVHPGIIKVFLRKLPPSIPPSSKCIRDCFPKNQYGGNLAALPIIFEPSDSTQYWERESVHGYHRGNAREEIASPSFYSGHGSGKNHPPRNNNQLLLPDQNPDMGRSKCTGKVFTVIC
jgi:hypothetical protein